MIGLAVAIALAAVSLGTPLTSPTRLPAVLADASSLEHVVLVEIRLPRLVMALLAGAAMGGAGLLLQEALRNPLAVPELLGVSSGAALAVAVVVVHGLAVPVAAQPLVALGGALAGAVLFLLMARSGRGPAAVLLIGAATTAALQALLLAVLAMAERIQYETLFRYLVGSLSGVTWDHVALVGPWLLGGVPPLLLSLPVLGALRLGDDAAAGLGTRVALARLGIVALAATLVAAVVGPCGPIAWVGFVAPHVARRLWPRADARGWLPATIVVGALVTALADLVARLALAPLETPLGAWTAALGAGLAIGARKAAR